ncbi:hypothetical protein F2P81_010780 [Scophthalmus maximus]|uniref:Uncharacterized protein n=1 Tax=Scophthalmus maximus TaxID=52904 RepID=A0A6A4SRT2_SCOMX|nr:hypothetical protein F2P81_010780 [Scophthalmus maximus]
MEDLAADLYAAKRPAPAYIPQLLLGVDDSGSDGESELLVSDDDEYEDSLTPSGRAAKPVPAAAGTEQDETATPSTVLDMNMQDVCKRAAAKLNIPWPTMQAEISRSRYDPTHRPRTPG